MLCVVYKLLSLNYDDSAEIKRYRWSKMCICTGVFWSAACCKDTK